MAFRHGSKAVITVNAVDISAFCTSLDLSIDQDTGETTTFGSAWKTFIAGTMGGKLSIQGDYDGTVTTGPASAILLAQATAVPIAVVHKPGGTLAGQRTNSFNALITSYAETSPVGGVITFKADLLPTGTITSVTQ
jgi:hypothetical protein